MISSIECVKNTEGEYICLVDNIAKGRLLFSLGDLSHSNAPAFYGNLSHTVKRTGSWKSSIEITNADNRLILKTQYEKWYDNALTVEFKKKYVFLIKNKPVVKWVLLGQGIEILTYGLNII